MPEAPRRLVSVWPSRESILVGLNELKDHWSKLTTGEREFVRHRVGELLCQDDGKNVAGS